MLVETIRMMVINAMRRMTAQSILATFKHSSGMTGITRIAARLRIQPGVRWLPEAVVRDSLFGAHSHDQASVRQLIADDPLLP